MKRAVSCWLVICLAVAQIGRGEVVEDDKQIEQLDKSFELFKYSNLLKQRTWFKLKCEFTVNSANRSSTSYKIRWFKLNDRKNLTVLNEFDASFEQHKRRHPDAALANNDFSNVFVSELEMRELEGRAANLSRLRSSLLFVFKNPQDVNKASGLYLCKPDLEGQGTATGGHLTHLQSIQRITINEMINQNEMLFRLNYTVLQVTSSRLLVEIRQLRTFNQQINSNSRLVYCVNHAGTNSPVVRGTIDVSQPYSSQADLHPHKFFLAIESLQPNTSYVFTVYLKTNLNADTNYVQLVANHTFVTPERLSAPQNSTVTATKEDDSDDEDEDYDTEEYDDSMDASQEVDDGSSRRVITCEVLKKPSGSDRQRTSLFSSQSLFNAVSEKSNKFKSNLVTINFSEGNLHKLVQLSFNLSTSSPRWTSSQLFQHHHYQQLKHFRDLFNLNKFNKELFDYAIFFDCRKQLQQTGFKASEPMCLLNLESAWSTIPLSGTGELDYDYFDSGGVLGDDHFSVQTSFEQPMDRSRSVVSFYVASACHRRKRPIRNSHQFGSLSKDALGFTPSPKTKYQVRLNENRNSSSSGDKLVETSTPHPGVKSHSVLSQSELLNAIKKQHIAQLTNINDCQLLNENEIQFQIESKLTDTLSLHRTTLNRLSPLSGSHSFFNYTPYFYQIEIHVPTVSTAATTTTSPNKNTKLFKPKFRALSHFPVWLKFKFRIEDSVQIVRVNLTSEESRKSRRPEWLTETPSGVEIEPGEEEVVDIEEDQYEREEEEYLYETNQRVGKLNAGEIILTKANNNNNNDSSSSLNQTSTSEPATSSVPIIKTPTKLLTTFAEPLFALRHNSPAVLPALADYVFKIRILTEDNIQLSEFELNVSCKRMSSTNAIGNGINDGNNSFVGLIMTCVCAIVIIIVGSVFCLFIKRKYGLSPDYFLNLKNNILLRSSNGVRNHHHHHHHHHHGNHINAHLGKRSKAATNANYQHQIQQYQLETKPNSNLLNINASNAHHPSFNYSYVRILKQKWHNTSNRNESNMGAYVAYPHSPSAADKLASSSSESQEASRVGARTRQLFKQMKGYLSWSSFLGRARAEQTAEPKYDTVASRSASSSASSSPLVLFSAAGRKDAAEAAVENELAGEQVVAANPSELALFPTTNFATLCNNRSFFYKEDHDSIGLELFESYVQKMHIDGDFGFAQLYEEITAFTKSYSYSSDVALLECNRCKNRYSNILTYDHSRVKLACDERDETGGYINANYVDGYQKPNAYIATQGPMPNTFGDFWRMIWEKNCSIIVMITNVKEKGRIKCDQYWPEDGVDCYSNIQVTHLHTITLAFYTKRIFTIKLKTSKKRCNSERLVYQFHFTDWPDHGVPYYIMPVLSFIKKSSRANPEMGGPIVVHCSAGVGRTGTYIVIDAMLQQAQVKATLNIHTFLKHIRHQRNYLVQTEEQFIFIYDALLEAIKSGESELGEHNYKSYLDQLGATGPAASAGSLVGAVRDGEMLIDRQFELICEFKPNEYQVSIALLPFNLEKNRNPKIIPVNNSRVILSKDPAVDGSEYINASYLHGCNRQDEFIITQWPLASTQCSFWQMVWDNNSSQIVCLQSEETEGCEPYWLPLGEVMKCGESFTVQLREENFDMDFVLRDFLLQSIDEDYEFNCRMITACYWPDSCTPVKSAFELVNKVKAFRLHAHQIQGQNLSSGTSSSGAVAAANQAIQSSLANLPPVIVHDLCGSYRAATFCALYTLQDLVHLEASVNVYETAKMFYLKRPGLWIHKSNIMFLYEAVEYLFDEMHSNNNYQFRNYLNLNIDNHFHNQLYSSNHYYNQAPAPLHAAPQPVASSLNHISLTLLPNLNLQGGQQKQPPPAPISSKSLHGTLTLPNNLSQSVLSGSGKFNLPVIVQPAAAATQQPPVRINETIGTRLHNSFQDSMTTVPLTSAKISMDPQQNHHHNHHNHHTKSSFIDLPRSMLPSFFDSKQQPPQARRSTSANYRTSKALKFMNTMRIKSVSFKRALFSGNSGASSGEKSLAGMVSNGPIAQVQALSASQTIQMQPTAVAASSSSSQQSPQTVQMETPGGVLHPETGDEQKPSIIISISSGSSSATTSSSSTALSSTPITTATTESISYKSGFATAAPNKLSREKLN